jgi:hypothetical protein
MERLLFLFLGGGVALMALSLPALLSLIRPNSIFGLRIGAALHSPALWYEINRGAGWRLFKTGAVTIIAAVTLSYVPGLSVGGYYASCSIVMLGMLLSGLLKTARHLNFYQISEADVAPSECLPRMNTKRHE